MTDPRPYTLADLNDIYSAEDVSPLRIRATVEALDDMAAERDHFRESKHRLEAERDHWKQARENALAACEMLKAERDAARADAERLKGRSPHNFVRREMCDEWKERAERAEASAKRLAEALRGCLDAMTDAGIEDSFCVAWESGRAALARKKEEGK